ncbi:Trichothecene C-15 hydroxylase [Metarhizium anisopliae]|nr:Trichothecene C-15 hydroxylase [Metarhizium anisopliae]
MIEQLQRHFVQDVSRSTSVGRVNEESLSRGNAFDLAAWFTRATFDIVGDLTLGESLSCLENLDTRLYVWFMFKACAWGAQVVVLWYLDLRDLAEALRYFLRKNKLKVLEETNMMLSKWMDGAKQKDDLIEPVIKAKARAARPNPSLIMPCFTGS